MINITLFKCLTLWLNHWTGDEATIGQKDLTTLHMTERKYLFYLYFLCCSLLVSTQDCSNLRWPLPVLLWTSMTRMYWMLKAATNLKGETQGINIAIHEDLQWWYGRLTEISSDKSPWRTEWQNDVRARKIERLSQADHLQYLGQNDKLEVITQL